MTETIQLDGNGPYSFEIRNRHDKNPSSSGYRVRFKQLVLENIAYDLHTIQYEYDLLSRLLSADYHLGKNELAPIQWRKTKETGTLN